MVVKVIVNAEVLLRRSLDLVSAARETEVVSEHVPADLMGLVIRDVLPLEDELENTSVLCH